jgi:hypothetical protein
VMHKASQNAPARLDAPAPNYKTKKQHALKQQNDEKNYITNVLYSSMTPRLYN